MAEKYWNEERQAEFDRLGEEAYWAIPENLLRYQQAMNFTMGGLTGKVPYPNALEKIRWRDVKAGDFVYYRRETCPNKKHKYWRLKIKGVRRLHRKNLIEITYINMDDYAGHYKKTMTVHARNLTIFLGHEAEKTEDAG